MHCHVVIFLPSFLPFLSTFSLALWPLSPPSLHKNHFRRKPCMALTLRSRCLQSHFCCFCFSFARLSTGPFFYLQLLCSNNTKKDINCSLFFCNPIQSNVTHRTTASSLWFWLWLRRKPISDKLSFSSSRHTWNSGHKSGLSFLFPFSHFLFLLQNRNETPT